MAFSLTFFANSPGPDQLSALDNNITTLSASAPISCGVAGTNVLVLTPNAAGLVPSATITAYAQNMTFSGVAAGTNTGAMTAGVGSLPVLPVYKDTGSGPVALTGRELISGNAFTLLYDVALNSGSGGFHLITSTAITSTAIAVTSVQVGGNATLTNLLSGNSPTLTFTATPGWTSQDQLFSVTAGLASNLPAIGDFVQVNPPSIPGTGVLFQGYILGVGSISSVASAATINIRLLNAASASLASNSGIYRWATMRTVP